MVGKRIIALSLFALVALTLGLFAASGTEAGTYKPTNLYSIVTNTPGVASDNSLTFTIPSPDYNYEDSSMWNFTPIAGYITPGDQLPIGAWVGNLSSATTLGLLNSACNQSISPGFDLYNASIDNSVQLTPAEMAWTNTGTPPPDVNPANGKPDYLEKYPAFLNTMLDPDGSGVKPPLKPRARYAGHTMVSTSYMLIEVIVLNPGQMAQLPGIKTQFVPGLGWALITALNNPVDQIEAPGAVSDFCTYLQSTTILYGTTKAGGAYGDAGGAVSQINPAAGKGILMTDTHLDRTYSQSERDYDNDGWENDMDPCPYIANPLWDPRVACSPGPPPTKPGDVDCDGLPDVCDPFPAVHDPDEDEDNDGYNNQQDICPQVADGPAPGQNQIDSDSVVENADKGPKPDSIGDACDDSDNDGLENGSTVAPGTQDTGNCRDGIDNDGDTLPDMRDPQCLLWTDKAEIAALRTQAQIFGTNPGTGLYFHALPWAPVCVGAGLDGDGDTYCDSLECIGGYPACPGGGLGSDPANINSTPESYAIDVAITGVGANVNPALTALQSCSDTVDNDGNAGADALDPGCTCNTANDTDCDGVPNAGDNCPAVWNPEQTDNDGDGQGDVCDTDDDADGFTDAIEWWTGTDPFNKCPNLTAPKRDAWPLDQDKNRTITVVGDVLKYSGKIGATVAGSPPTSWANRRLDLDGNGTITVVGDVLKYSGKIGSTCT
jgi:hypothetical protein